MSALELSRIADAVGERVEWFFDKTPEAIISHRNLQDPGAVSPAIDRLIELTARNVEFVTARTGQAWPKSQVLDRPGSGNDIEEAAAEARKLIGLSPAKPALNLSAEVAGLGLFTFSFDMGTDAADAASMLLKEGGVAIVNGSLRVGRRRLALAHELGHYLFADEYTIDWRISEQQNDDVWEARLDRFGRALLLPRQGVKADLARLRAEGNDLRTTAIKLASAYRVDMSTLARRLVEVELIDQKDADFIRSVRTTKADIIDHNLVVPRELEAPHLPDPYIKGILTIYRNAVVSAARATDLLFDTWGEDDLPEVPKLPESSIWKFVS
ncbi:ImmA/IrrE family metallo-endopeptidase [Nonomuraea salmonea]|uniref:ImmA/IrrE family metallo-endopeptidase n=1 Tax=Nonomuraea salmonea TaxID=46181 RepID=UPI002FEA39BE